jgi:hypothetical protein
VSNGISHWKLLAKPQRIVLMAEAGAALSWIAVQWRSGQRLRNSLVPILAATLGMQVYGVLGGEGMYDVYSLSIGPAMFLGLGYALDRPSRRDC